MTFQSAHNKDEIVSEQYDTESAAQFYKIVVGDGGSDIHYGIYDTPTDSVINASAKTVSFLLDQALDCGVKFGPGIQVLDSGAGNGGSAHKIAQSTGAHITCLNICKGQNEENIKRAKELGIHDQIDVHTGSFDKLSDGWSEKFDVIWSQDAFVHSRNKPDMLSEAFRCLKAGGYMVFTDIMASPMCFAEDLAFFKKLLHVENVYQPGEYEAELKVKGFQVLRTRDLTSHLKFNFRRMIERAQSERYRLNKCSDEFLRDYTDNLKKNVQILSEREAQQWFAIVAQKPLHASGSQNVIAPSMSSVRKGNRGFKIPQEKHLLKRYVTTKFQNIAVTDKSVFYHGSVSICRKLMNAIGIEEYEAVDVVNLRNGARWTTYVLPCEDEGGFTLNGGAARLGEKGDECVVMTFGLSETYVPAYVICCDPQKNNAIIDEFYYEQS